MIKIVKTNHQDIYGLSSEQREEVKDALTYDNPAYKQAVRHSRNRYITIPPYLTYYSEKSVRSDDGERKKVLSVPLGVSIPKILGVKVCVKDQRNSVPVDFPEFKLTLREDQRLAEEAYLAEQENKHTRNIIQLPTGKGKSILAIHLASLLGQKTLVLVHKDDLVVGWKKDIALCFGKDFEVGLIKAKSRKVGKQITIATVQTLSRMSPEERDSLANQFGFVIQDECHHVGLNIFNIIDSFNSRYKLGLSATPKRTDGLNFVFDLFFGGLCYKHIVTEKDEDISQVTVRVLDSPFKYKPFVYKNQVFNLYDFPKKDLPDNFKLMEEIPYKDRPTLPYLVLDSEAVKSDLTMQMVCKKIVEEYKKGHSVIAMFTQKEHINMYNQYLQQWIPEDEIMLYYSDNTESSAVLMKKAESKEVMVTLATYAKATEGTNVKSWEVLFLVSSINNSKNVEQATGRIRRKKEGKINPVIVYDVRYEDCYSLRSHYQTRLKTYKELKYKIEDKKDNKSKGKFSMFSRGYH